MTRSSLSFLAAGGEPLFFLVQRRTVYDLLIRRHLLPDIQLGIGEDTVLRGNILHPVIPLHKAAAVIEHIAAGGKMAALVDPHVPPVGFKVEVGQHIIRHIQHFHFLDIGPAQRLLTVDTEHGIEQYAELESKVAEISAANDEAAAALKDVERRLGNMAVLIKNLTTYKQLRPVVLEYRKAKDKAAFRREHESQLILYEAAAKAIKDAGITRLPDLAALKAEYRELDKQKARLYEQYGEVKRELKEYGIIKQNVDSILRVTPGKEQAQEL